MTHIKKLVTAAMLLAAALLLPFLTGQIPEIGNMLSPMHIPILLCGFICGGPYAIAIGLIAPPLRYLLFSMPPIFPTGLAMAFELASYGFFAALFYKLLPKKPLYLYVSLILSMLAGRIVWGIAMLIISFSSEVSFSMQAFFAGAFAKAVPGIILHILLVPLVVLALKRAKLMPHD